MSGLYETEIETTLDEMLAYNMSEASYGTNRFKNVLFIGASGVGKTALVRKWLQRAYDDFGVNCCCESSFYFTHTVSADNLKLLEDATDGRPNTILFIDEFDAAPKTCRETLTDVIDNHTYMVDGAEKHLDGLLFVIATARPAYADYSNGHRGGTISGAADHNNYPIEESEQNRFNTVHVFNDKKSCLEDIERRLDERIQNTAKRGRSSKGFEKRAKEELRVYLGCKSLAEAILKNPNFRFQSEDGDIMALEVKASRNLEYDGFTYTFSARDLEQFILSCLGTKQSLTYYVREQYNNDLNMTVSMEASLIGYEDPDFDEEIEEILNAVDDDD